MEKIDFKKQYARLFKASAKAPALVEAPPLDYLMIDGEGDPKAPAFQEAIEALYGLSYTLKFTFKNRSEADWGVPPLEALWWADAPDQGEAFRTHNTAAWRWTAMILQPPVVTAAAVDAAREELKRRGKAGAFDRARLERLDEGLSAQIMHVGPHDAVAPVIGRLHAFIHESGYELAGKHHEIYLSDPRRTAPEKLKTLLREPVRKAGDNA